MPEHGETGIGTEAPTAANRIFTKVDNDLKPTFVTAKNGAGWTLSINRDHFLSRGFTPAEIDGATHLEKHRLAAQISVNTEQQVVGLIRWQESGENVPNAASFKTLFERISALKALEKIDPLQAANARNYLGKIASHSPSQEYPEQLLQALLQRSLGLDTTVPDQMVLNVLENLVREERIDDRSVSAVDALCSPVLSFGSKEAWFYARVIPRLEFLTGREEDRKKQTSPPQPQQDSQPAEGEAQGEGEGEGVGEQEDQSPPTPPEAQDEYQQSRGKEASGNSDPIFTIDPYHGGYWETESYDILDERTGVLRKSVASANKLESGLIGTDGEIVCAITGMTGTNQFSLPLSLNLTPNRKSVQGFRDAGMTVSVDADGHVFIKSRQDVMYYVSLMKPNDVVPRPFAKSDIKTAEKKLPKEIAQKLEEIRSLDGDSVTKAEKWREFVQTSFVYPSNDEVQGMYANVDASRGSRLSAMAQGNLMDCFLAREFFVAGLKRLGLEDLEWASVNGYYLNVQQEDGSGHLTSGNGHAWVKARLRGSNEWFIFDPTPAGDPTKQGEGAGEEFGDESSELINGQDMAELENEITGGLDGKENIDPKERYLLEFAKEAGMTPEEAQKILNRLKEVDELRDRSGRNILKRVKEQFDRIIQVYTKKHVEHFGNVQMSRGHELIDPVEARMDVITGNLDPHGFSRRNITDEEEVAYGGFDLEIVADGSGSMTNSVGNIVKYVAQQKMSYLLHRGAHYFAQEAKKRHTRLITPLAVRSSQYIFRDNKIEEIKDLTAEFTPVQMATLWKRSAANIGGGTPAHLGLQAVLDRIPEDEAKLLREKKLLKIVALISDGEYDNVDAVDEIKTKLEEMNVIVAEFKITDQQSLENLSEDVAAKVVEAAKLLIPQKVQK